MRHFRRGFIALLFLLPAPVGTAQPTADLSARIDSFIRPYVDTHNFSGVVLASRGDEILYERTFGMANYRRHVRVTPDTKFFIASLTKTFTAAAILKLQDEGLLKVSDTIERYLPDYPRGFEITIDHLLTHYSGLPRIVFLPDYKELSQQHHTLPEVVDLFKNLPLVSDPGERYGYSNANYVLLARIIEVVSGQSYANFIAASLFRPLGLRHTGDGGASKSDDVSKAFGYDPVGTSDLEPSRYFDFSIFTGAGSMYSTARDLRTWIRSLAKGEVLSKESTDLMFDGPTYGLIVDELYARRMVSMSGWSDVGFTSSLTYEPHDDLAVIVINNIDISSVAGEIGTGVMAALMDAPYEGLRLDDRPVDDGLAAAATGVYHFGEDFFVPHATMEIVAEGGRLFALEGPNRKVGLLRVGELEFVHRSSWGRVVFRRGDSGKIRAMRFYGRFNAEKD